MGGGGVFRNLTVIEGGGGVNFIRKYDFVIFERPKQGGTAYLYYQYLFPFFINLTLIKIFLKMNSTIRRRLECLKIKLRK